MVFEPFNFQRIHVFVFDFDLCRCTVQRCTAVRFYRRNFLLQMRFFFLQKKVSSVETCCCTCLHRTTTQIEIKNKNVYLLEIEQLNVTIKPNYTYLPRYRNPSLYTEAVALFERLWRLVHFHDVHPRSV